MITISANLDEVITRLPSEKAARTAMARAINRSLDAARTTAARETVKRYAVKQRQVREKSRITKTNASSLSAALTFSGPALNIADFRINPRQPQPARRPVLRVTIGKSQGAKPYKGAFVIPVRSGTVKAFRRVGKDRFPITPVYGPSIPSLIGSPEVSAAVRDRAQEVVITRLDHEIARELGRGLRRG